MSKTWFIFVLLFASVYSDDDAPKFILTTGVVEDNIELTTDNLHLVNPSLPTIFLVHGYIESGSVLYFQTIPKEFKKKGPCNVINVDWGSWAWSLYFTQASQRVKPVGILVGGLIVELYTNHGLLLENVHIVGHSLGSHVAGHAGKEVKKRLDGKKIGRISGLDPAGPNFDIPFWDNDDTRLSSGDAVMVDNVYTNRGLFGTVNELGTVNIYANSGNFQPGCLLGLDNDDNTMIGICSHQRSVSYFLESINSVKFKVRTCYSLNLLLERVPYWCWDTDVVFGENIAPGTTGRYFFDTNSQPPYAKG